MRKAKGKDEKNEEGEYNKLIRYNTGVPGTIY